MWAKTKTQSLSPEESFCHRRVFLSRRCLFKLSFFLLVGLCSAVKSGRDIIIDSRAMPTLGGPVCGRHDQFMPSLLIQKYIFIYDESEYYYYYDFEIIFTPQWIQNN